MLTFWWREMDSNHSPKDEIYSLAAESDQLFLSVEVEGHDPPTFWLKTRRSANWAIPLYYN